MEKHGYFNLTPPRPAGPRPLPEDVFKELFGAARTLFKRGIAEEELISPTLAFANRASGLPELKALSGQFAKIGDSSAVREQLLNDFYQRFRGLTPVAVSDEVLILRSALHSTYSFRRCCEVIRQAVPIEEVARRYTDLKPLGGRAWFDGRCPLPGHEDKTPSFYLYPPGRFYCYGCGRGGDVVDLEFHCGDYGELWEAMMSLALEYGVELPERPESWRRKQVRQKPVRDGIEAATIHATRQRLYRRFFEPLVLATIDPEDRQHDAQLFWEATERLAEHLVAHMMASPSDG